jgi:hypothetical protein
MVIEPIQFVDRGDPEHLILAPARDLVENAADTGRGPAAPDMRRRDRDRPCVWQHGFTVVVMSNLPEMSAQPLPSAAESREILLKEFGKVSEVGVDFGLWQRSTKSDRSVSMRRRESCFGMPSPLHWDSARLRSCACWWSERAHPSPRLR